MNEQVRQYLDDVCARIRCREVHAEVRLELESHLADRAEALVADGYEERVAVTLALQHMGDPAAVGAGLDKAHRPRTDWKLLAVTSLLVLVGLWVIYAVTVSESYGPFGFFGTQLRWSAAGLAVAAGLYFLDYRRLQRYGWWLFGGALVLSGAASFIGGDWWMAWESTVANPLLFVPGLAALFSRWDWDRRWAQVQAVALGAAPVLLYVTIPRMNLTLLYLLLWLVMLLLSRPRLRDLALPAMAGGAGALTLLRLIMIRPHIQYRLLAWVAPASDPMGSGYMTIQSVKTVQGAGLWGNGPLARLDTVPEPHTDMVFTYMVHTLGWAGGAAFAVLVLLFLVRLARLAGQGRNRFGLFLVAGVLSVFGLQFVWHMAMAAGWAPLVSMDLPFVSFGRQQMVQLAAVGLVLSVFRRKDLGRAAAQK